MNARLIMIVRLPNIVKITNVKILVLILFVARGLNAKQKLIELFVNVLLAYKEIH